ncbi:hypothetical protein LJD63_10150, partial [Veillonella nakazawae]
KKGKVKFSKLIKIFIVGFIFVFILVGGIGAYRVIKTTSFYSYPEYANYIYNKNYVGLAVYVFFHYLTIGFENLL